MKLRWVRNTTGSEWWTVHTDEGIPHLDSGGTKWFWIWKLWRKYNPECL